MRFRGNFFDGKSSKPKIAEVVFDHGLPFISIRVIDQHEGNGYTFQIQLNDLDTREAIGRHFGSIVFNKVCEIQLPDKATHQFFKKQLPRKSFWSWVDNIENSWPLVLAGLAVVAIFIAGLTIYGLPAAAKSISFKCPDSLLDTIGKNALEQLDKQMLQESALNTAQQDSFRQGFENILLSNQLDLSRYQLHFYKSKIMGANAFALPSGDIVLLDGLVNIEGFDKDEVLAVLAHEIAHVEERHGVQMLIRFAGIGAIASIALGDIQSATGLVAMIPKLLIEKGYSREFETEADSRAVSFMFNAGIKPENLISSLEKLTQHAGGELVPSLLSTHPIVSQRKETILNEIYSMQIDQ